MSRFSFWDCLGQKLEVPVWIEAKPVRKIRKRLKLKPGLFCEQTERGDYNETCEWRGVITMGQGFFSTCSYRFSYQMSRSYSEILFKFTSIVVTKHQYLVGPPWLSMTALLSIVSLSTPWQIIPNFLYVLYQLCFLAFHLNKNSKKCKLQIYWIQFSFLFLPY